MRGVALLAILLAGLLIAPLFGVHADEPRQEATEPTDPPISADQSVGTVTSSLQWSSSTSGDLAIKLELRFHVPTTCGFILASGGWINGQPIFQYSGHDDPGRGWTVVTEDTYLGARASGVGVSLGTLNDDLWVARSVHGFFASGTEEWLFAGFDLTPVPHDWTGGKSVVFNLVCDDAFLIDGIKAGRDVLGMTPHLMDKGVGATAFGTTVNVVDTERDVFGGSEVAFRFRAEPNHQTGLLRLSGPGGGSAHILSGDSEIFVDGPAGVHQAEFTRLGSDPQWSAVGIFAGLQDVQSLDAAAAL